MNSHRLVGIPGTSPSSQDEAPIARTDASAMEPGASLDHSRPRREPRTPHGFSGRGHMSGGSLQSVASRPWHLHWGATCEEASRPLPGDDLVRNPLGASTRCITIEAAPELVWRHTIAHLFGSSALLSDHRSGDILQLRCGASMQVRSTIAPHHLLLFQMIDLESERFVGPDETAPRRRLEWSVSFIIESDPRSRRSRLIVRSRIDNSPRRRISDRLGAILDMPHFAQERSMLIDVKRSAERSARAEANEKSQRAVSVQAA